jgi:steroid delta-isomerase-like uncharacterized protein
VGAQENKAIVLRYLMEMVNQRAVGLASQLFAEEYVSRSPHGPETRGPESMAQLVNRLASAFPDVLVAVEDIVAEGEKVAARITIHGTHRGEWRGIAPTGSRVAFTEHQVYHLAGGKIVARWFLVDLGGALAQLGAA